MQEVKASILLGGGGGGVEMVGGGLLSVVVGMDLAVLRIGVDLGGGKDGCFVDLEIVSRASRVN